MENSSLKRKMVEREVRERNKGATRRQQQRKVDEALSRFWEIERAKMESIEKRLSTVPQDATEHFLRSLIPYIKRIRPEKKMEFQSRVHDLVQEFAFGNKNRENEAEDRTKDPMTSQSSEENGSLEKITTSSAGTETVSSGNEATTAEKEEMGVSPENC